MPVQAVWNILTVNWNRFVNKKFNRDYNSLVEFVSVCIVLKTKIYDLPIKTQI